MARAAPAARRGSPALRLLLLTLPLAVVAAEHAAGPLEMPGLTLALVVAVCTYYGGAAIGACNAVQCLVLVALAGGSRQGSFTWTTGLAGSIVGPAAVVWLDRLVRRHAAERRRADAERARFRSLVQGVPGVVWELDAESGELLFVSEQTREVLGREPEEFVHAGCESGLVHPDDTWSRDRRVAAASLGEPLVRELRLRHADGSWRWVRDTCVLGAGEDGRPVLRGVAVDITEEHATRHALQLGEERLRRIFEASQIGFLVIDPTTRTIESANPTFCDISGYAQAELVGLDPTRLMHEHRSPVLASPEMPKLLSGELPSLRTQGVMVRPDGEQVVVDIVALVVPGGDGRPRLVGTVADRTEYLQAADQMRQAQKMEAVGRLAGGIAHDFNNLLTIIDGYARMALEAGLAPGQRSDVEAVVEAAERAAQLTRQLLAFSRKQVLRPRLLDVNEVTSALEGMLRRLLDTRIEIRSDLEPSAGLVLADQAQLEQVLMNLIINARDAMPNGGVLTIRTRATVLGRGSRHSGAAPGAYVAISVSDTGVGMDDATRARIFEPFFTTKDEHRGTGLGLATVYGIVQQSGGDIDVVSTVGAGTTFTVYLPRAAAHDEGPDAAAPGRAAAATPKRILLVEDEPAVRDLTTTMLARAGHEVIAAPDPETALELLDAGAAIDLLVSDVVLPSCSGLALAAEVAARRPGTPVVFVSGYADDAFRDGASELPHHLLEKPFTSAQLLSVVAEATSPAGGDLTRRG